ncbi:MAG TPA: isocitrate/isopropylmalate dehydrogenase family protein [Nitrososphaera sp.]|nr:isocitrate/isopropylmalate dehydrogenase family protein [Nitrososphaera sp.]HEX2615481.1 isocitrate/isopropylmalate dehydrogenase family protein [Nitrososphaera sp.]
MARYNISLIRGDGIGPEQTAAARKILETISDNSPTKFAINEVEAGDAALARHGKALPEFSVDVIKKSQACLKGPVGESAADVIIVLRRMFDLYANVRPARSYPNIPSISGKVDMVTVRENTEDVYLGWEFNADENTVVALRVTSERASRRIAEYAFKVATIRDGKRKVVAVHKANVMRKGDGLFAATCRDVAKKYPKIQYSELYVDAASMNLIRNPEEFDVIVTTNLFGDILSDEAAQVVGGLGMGPAANIGENFALFEPVHGAAFDIAGKNAANPSSILLSAKMMLEWLSDKHNDKNAILEGRRIEDAIVGLLRQDKKTKDIGGKLSTTEFTELVAKAMY